MRVVIRTDWPATPDLLVQRVLAQEVGNERELCLSVRRERPAETAVRFTIKEDVNLDPRSGTRICDEFQFAPRRRHEINRNPGPRVFRHPPSLHA
jgi:hypothetical protein